MKSSVVMVLIDVILSCCLVAVFWIQSIIARSLIGMAISALCTAGVFIFSVMEYYKFKIDSRACRCCGATEQSDSSCKEPFIGDPCMYYGMDWDKPKGERFLCYANGQKDGNCEGELPYVDALPAPVYPHLQAPAPDRPAVPRKRAGVWPP